MKKKFILLPLMLLSLIACDNNTESKTNFELSNNYTKVHIYATNKCYKIQKWCHAYDNTYKIRLENGTDINIYKNNCFLISEKCPICESEQ